jgi:hypothetical protein
MPGAISAITIVISREEGVGVSAGHRRSRVQVIQIPLQFGGIGQLFGQLVVYVAAVEHYPQKIQDGKRGHLVGK